MEQKIKTKPKATIKEFVKKVKLPESYVEYKPFIPTKANEKIPTYRRNVD